MESESSRGDAAKPVPERGAFMSVVEGGISGPRPEPSQANLATRYLGAFDLLESASKALEFLESRRDDLETALDDVSKRAEEAVAASVDRAADWQRFAADLKARNAQLERQVEDLSRRAAATEAALATERERAEAAERRAAEAQKLLRGLHDKVMSAFGQGTRAYDILAAIPPATPSNVVAMPKAG